MKNILTVTSAVALLALGTPALAQQQNAQPAGGNQNSAAGTDVQVQQPAPEVTVQQPAPEVTVERPAPEVTVQQPEPNVTVQQAEPNVNVEQAEPNVTVERAGEPNVDVVRPGQQNAPEQQGSQEAVQDTGQEAGRAGGDGEGVQTPTAGMAPTGPAAEPRLMGDQVSGMIGTNAVTANDENVGEIENLLIGADGQVEAAIIEWGGFLGIGSRTAAVPWSELRLNEAGDRVVIDMTRDEMEALPAYDGDPASVAGIDADATPVR
ncbi:PRC-barrel domain-containing protein [Skermanella sp. TT6]|uniref:PRC-barrel domain-containing protein n=1 Tax=Skermanella cutis TaxID=2775420 RepID=A0ABX7B2F4_9PROT|nr:PRC-barrel domain-containing protein [Skermanella sp. TT6]QQP88513.1 PRC-barrel domain-containing protein [Skermanella sp. TT6]